jgi:hypothetical protein
VELDLSAVEQRLPPLKLGPARMSPRLDVKILNFRNSPSRGSADRWSAILFSERRNILSRFNEYPAGFIAEASAR